MSGPSDHIPVDRAALIDMLDILAKEPLHTPEALSHIAGLSGGSDGITLLMSTSDKVLPALLHCYQLSSSTKNITAIKTHVCSTVSNLLADERSTSCEAFASLYSSLAKESTVKRILKDALKEPDEVEKVLRLRTVIMLGNVTSRSTEVCQAILAFANKPSNQQLGVLDRIYANALDVTDLGTAFLSVLSNLTQLAEFRTLILSQKKSYPQEIRLKALLPYATVSPCARRREAVLAAVKNCCFTTHCHESLVSETGVNILPSLLLPLADGSHSFTAEENSRLLVELRYLDPEKRRETSAEIRMLIVEALYQLCATRIGREALRNAGAYLILREYHRWEEDVGKNSAINARLFDVIEIIISDEHSEKTFDDLHKVEIPEDLREKFEKEVEPVNAGSN